MVHGVSDFEGGFGVQTFENVKFSDRFHFEISIFFPAFPVFPEKPTFSDVCETQKTLNLTTGSSTKVDHNCRHLYELIVGTSTFLHSVFF